MDCTLSIPDMTCGNCLTHVRATIGATAGASIAGVDLRQREVRVTVRDAASLADLQHRLADEGYPATVRASEA